MNAPAVRLIDRSTDPRIDPETVRGAAVDGLGAGVETARHYLSEDFPSGSQRTVERWLKTLLERDDVVRIWFKAIGGKAIVWQHDGPLAAMPDIDHLFDCSAADEPTLLEPYTAAA